MPHPKTAIVVGGGLAGVAAALALAKNGIKVQLLEARRRLGGRAGSFINIDTKDAVDYCQHVGMGCCTNLRQLIDWLEQRDCWDEHRQLHFYGPDGSYQRLAALPFVPAPLHLTGWLLRWPGLGIADRFAVARGMLDIRKLKISNRTDQINAQQWLIEHHQTPQAIDRFWRTIIVSALGEELSIVNLSSVAKVLQDGFLNHRDSFHLLVPNRPLGELFGTRAEQSLLEHGVALHLQTRALSVVPLQEESDVPKENEPKKYAVICDRRGELRADAIVLAVPWFRLSELVAPSENENLIRIASQAEQLVSSPISGIHTWWDRQWLDTPHAAIVGRLCQWVFPKHAATESNIENKHYYQIVISASHSVTQRDATELKQRIHEDLAAVFPTVREAKLLRLQPVTDPQAVISVRVGSQLLRPNPSVEGTNIWLAGDWVQTGWPSTMEGAILSGWKAVEAILTKWGNPIRVAAFAGKGNGKTA